MFNLIQFDNWYVQAISAFITTMGFAIIFKIKGKNIFYSGIAGCISWIIHLLAKNAGLSVGLDYFLATFALAIFAEIIAKKGKIPATIILIPALIPLAPGGGIYYTMYNIIEEKYMLALQNGVTTFIIAGAMATGIFSASNIMRLIHKIKN